MADLIYKDLVISEAFRKKDAIQKVLVYAPLAFWTPHFETDLEIAQRHLDLGDLVDIVVCDKALPGCQISAANNVDICIGCISRSLHGTNLLSGNYNVLHISEYVNQESTVFEHIPKLFANQNELRKYKYDGFDAGMAVLSSMIDFIKNTEVDTIKYASLIHTQILSSIKSYLVVLKILNLGKYQTVYIFNGRWSMMRSAVRACEKVGVNYYTHERGSDFTKFSLYKNTLPHNFKYTSDRTLLQWSLARYNNYSTNSGNDFFIERKNRIEKSWYSFTKSQKLYTLPDKWDDSSFKIVIYTSTELEYAAIDDNPLNTIYISQIDGIKCLSKLISTNIPSAHIWVRVHPNDDSEASKLIWESCFQSYSNVTIIQPGSCVDSYSLFKNVYRVITFGSTIGVEATYWGCVVIALRESPYSGIDAMYEPANECELISLLTNSELKPKSKENAIKIGYFHYNIGDSFKYFLNKSGVFDLHYENLFNGHLLKPDLYVYKIEIYNLIKKQYYFKAIRLAELYITKYPSDDYGYIIKLVSLIYLGNKLECNNLLFYVRSISHELFNSVCIKSEKLFRNNSILNSS